jgi:hypothetical protein
MSLCKRISDGEIMKEIPVSLYKELSARLSSIILRARDKDALPVDLVKTIIFLWRQDQLESSAGVEALLKAAEIVAPEETSRLLSELGIERVEKILSRAH